MKELNLLEVVTATHTEELQHIAREEGLTGLVEVGGKGLRQRQGYDSEQLTLVE